MINLRGDLRAMVEEAFPGHSYGPDYRARVESALHAAVKRVLEREPSDAMMEAGSPPFKLLNDWAAEMQLIRGRVADWSASDPPMKQAYRAMTQQLLREIEE